MREERQLAIVLRMLEEYTGGESLSRFLKKFYNAHRNMGSGDRRRSSDLIYNYYRLVNALPGLPVVEQLALSNYLCADSVSPLLRHCLSYTALKIPDTPESFEEKVQQVRIILKDFQIENLFPCRTHVSEKIHLGPFALAHLHPPWLWIRVRKTKLEPVRTELLQGGFRILAEEGTALALPPRTPLEDLTSWMSGDFEIQDYSSQRAAQLATPMKNESWWDACAASGGKSLALLDKESTIRLTATDIRPAMLENLEERFRRTGQSPFRLMAADLADADFSWPDGELFDGILADVPCTGSGTWSRMPEWLRLFRETSIAAFCERQERIATTCTKFLRPGGRLVYITCSVFAAENEGMVQRLLQTLPLEKMEEHYFEGWNRGADTLYAAVLRRRKE